MCPRYSQVGVRETRDGRICHTPTRIHSMSGDVLVRPSDKWNDLAPKFDAHVHVHVHVKIHGACICLGGQGHGAKIHALVSPPLPNDRNGRNLRAS